MSAGVEEHAEPRAGTQNIDRAIAVLQLFRDGPAEIGITDISRRTQLSLSTAHRIVKALCAAHFMEQDPNSDRYRLGAALLALGQRALESSGLGAALPVLQRLAESTGESTSLGVRRDDTVVVVLTAASQQRLRFDHATGTSMDIHASAMGKVLMAFSGEAPATVVAALPELSTYTPTTITARDALVAELELVRATGYALNHEERYTGVFGVAAPVLDRAGVAVAVVGLQGPTVRLPAGGQESLGPVVRAAADEITVAL